ncbi:MAG: radical SAM protein, partial [Gammaproteobacteria bacterium]|nr:radical SAM protein [Gammaproteobacteria bacterium]
KAIADAEGLDFVYVGNVPGHAAEKTYCPGCGHVVIDRTGYFVRDVNMRNGKCQNCNHAIAGIWSK